MMRIQIAKDPFFESKCHEPWPGRDHWPAAWVSSPELQAPPAVVAFRLFFSAEEAYTARIHVSADERYELFLDGRRVGRGPERGDWLHWFFESYELSVGPGDHALVARVWALGKGVRPHAQISTSPGFLLAGEGAANSALSTDLAKWQVKTLSGYDFVNQFTARTGANLLVDGARFDWGFYLGGGEGWVEAKGSAPAVNGRRFNGPPMPNHPLIPAPLPAMMEKSRSAGLARHVETLDADNPQTVPIDPACDLPHELLRARTVSCLAVRPCACGAGRHRRRDA